jgi:acyl-CoA dehydrogenase
LACRSLTYTALDNGIKPAVASAITKYQASEIGRQIINDALDLHGGRGVMDGPKNYLTSHYKGLLISITGEGSNIITRNLIIFGQAMTRCHPFLSDLMQSAKNQDIMSFDKTLSNSIAYTLKNVGRLFWHTITLRRLSSRLPGGELNKYARELSYLSTAFAVISDMSILVYGGKLKHRERVCANLADMLSYLYIGVATIKYYTAHNLAVEELSHAKWALEHSIYKFQEAYFELLANFSNRFAAILLRIISFPLGRKYTPPSNVLESQLAQDMQTNSALREHFKQQIYIDSSNLGVVEDAFLLQNKVAGIKAKLDQAIKNKQINRNINIHAQLREAEDIGILSASDTKLYLEFWHRQSLAIAVDAFNKTLFKIDPNY